VVSTLTRTSLLLGLKTSSDDRVWSEFFSRYQPLIIAVGQQLGLSEQDAQDAAQETLLAFSDAYRKGKYDRDKGRLRAWLFGIATKKIRDIQRHRMKQPSADLPEKTRLLNTISDEHSISEVWESQWQRALMRECMDAVRRHMEPSTVRAFELFVLEDWPAEKVAKKLGLSRNAVFKAKRRVLSRMRRSYVHLQMDW